MHATTRKAHNMRRWLASTLIALAPLPAACTDDAVVAVSVTDTSANAADTLVPEIATADAQVAEVADTSTLPDAPAALDAPDTLDVADTPADAPDTKIPDTTPDTPKDIALPDPTTCGDGVCAGEEAVPNCPADCGFLTNRYAGPCAKPGSWDGCPEGYVCVARSAKGGGNVCTADFEGWAPIGDSHPASDFEEFAEYDVDTKTGLSWAKAVMGPMKWELALSACTTQTYGGFEDWRIPTEAELLTLVDYSVHSPASSMPGAVWPQDNLLLSTSPGNIKANFWFVALENGSPVTGPAGDTEHAKCVRRADPGAGSSGLGERFAISQDQKTFLDRISGANWARGQSADLGWNQAQAFCLENVPALTGQGWRPPTVGELRQLAIRRAASTAQALFGAEYVWGGWTSSPHWDVDWDPQSAFFGEWSNAKWVWIVNCFPAPSYLTFYTAGAPFSWKGPIGCTR